MGCTRSGDFSPDGHAVTQPGPNGFPWAFLACLIAASCCARAAETPFQKEDPVKAVIGREKNDALMLDNGLVSVRYDLKARSLSIAHNRKPFVTAGALWEDVATGGCTARIVKRRDALGAGKAIEIGSAGGASQTIALYASVPFACMNVSIRNQQKTPASFAQIVPFAGAVDLGFPAADLRVLGCDGLAPATKGKTSYVFLVVAEPKSRSGLVCGWLTHARGSGIVAATHKNDVLTLEARSEYGHLIVQRQDGDATRTGWVWRQ